MTPVQLTRRENFLVLPPVALVEVGPLRKVASPVLLPTVAGNLARLDLSICLFYSMKFARLGCLIPLGISGFNNSLFKDSSEGHVLSRLQ